MVGRRESREESTARTTRLSGGDIREGLAQGPGTAITEAVCSYTDTDRYLTGAASPSSGTGTDAGAGTTSGTSTGTATGTAPATGTTSGTSTGTGGT
ncbi:hypothetical protein KI387_012310, partial [Taxus chinensis]